MNDNERAKRYEKYYTKPHVARMCLDLIEPFIDSDTLLIEPSAGAGVFINETDRPIIGFDIAPDDDHLIIPRDFLTLPVKRAKKVAFIGNPPFGDYKALAAEFVNRCLTIGGTVGFILPITFRKWMAQNMIDRNARLILDVDLPENGFTKCGKDYKLRSAFQVWTLRKRWPDLRLKVNPTSIHKDFTMLRTKKYENAKAFYHSWDFAVVRTGEMNFSEKLWSPAELISNLEYILINAVAPDAMRRLLMIDYEALSRRSAVIRTITQCDIVEAYEAIKLAA